MTLQEVLNSVNELISHSYSEKTMTRWVNEVESMTGKLIEGIDEGPELQYPNDKDTTLIIPIPYDKAYKEYLKAMIRYEDRNYEEYNNDIMQFNNTFDEFKKYYIRNNLPNSYQLKNFW